MWGIADKSTCTGTASSASSPATSALKLLKEKQIASVSLRCNRPCEGVDGGYKIEKLPEGNSYVVYAEPLDGVAGPAQLSPAMQSLSRNATSDAGWPPRFSCVVPEPDMQFTVRTLPGP